MTWLLAVEGTGLVLTAAGFLLARRLMATPEGAHHAHTTRHAAAHQCGRWTQQLARSRAEYAPARLVGLPPEEEWDAATLAQLHDLGPGAGNPLTPVTTATLHDPALVGNRPPAVAKGRSPAPSPLMTAWVAVAALVTVTRRAEVVATSPWADATGTFAALVEAGDR